MKAKTPQIVALGGGGFSMERDGGALDDYVLSLTDAARPRVCFLPTASGDADHYVVRFYRSFLGRFPSDSEEAFWSGELDAGRQTHDSVIDLFGDAPEFTTRLVVYFQ